MRIQGNRLAGSLLAEREVSGAIFLEIRGLERIRLGKQRIGIEESRIFLDGSQTFLLAIAQRLSLRIHKIIGPVSTRLQQQIVSLA